ncbi:MAG: S9 family peptidase [Pseudomonadota bacterium]
MQPRWLTLLTTVALIATGAAAETTPDEARKFTAERVFDLELGDDPQISADGETIVYVRRSMDRQTDRMRGDLWTLDVDTGDHRPLVTGGESASNPRWSPDGQRLLYSTSNEGKPELRLLFMDTTSSISLAQFETSPGAAVWSPDGAQVAFTLFVSSKGPSFATPPRAPDGADWSAPVRVFDDLTFRFDGAGYLPEGATQVFTLPTEGGSPRQVTFGEVDYTQPAWMGSDTLLVSGNPNEDRHLDVIESDIFRVDLASLEMIRLTDRDGPDSNPVASPDNTLIAYLGYDDEIKSWQQTGLFVMSSDGSAPRRLAADFDHDMSDITWRRDSEALYALVEDAGDVAIVEVDLDGSVEFLVRGVGGLSIGRPYASGAYSVSDTRRPIFAYTANSPDKPADIAISGRSVDDRVLTSLNADLLPYLDMATIEEIQVPSTHDGLEIEAWVALPHGFTADGSYPMILEIHGGPFTMYAPSFAAEIQRYAAEGYVTVYANPRGSTGYGAAFAEEIDLAYPGYDYDDLMSVVEHLVAKNYVDEDRLFVTGGSGGGILTAWIVGKTDRFAAAASIKPVINWMTMALSADIAAYVRRHWIRADPWEDPDAFLDRSPIMLIDSIVTPTMVMVGEEDWRTPAWEAEQFYTALHLKGVDTVLVRVPGSPHYIAGRPSRLIAKTDNIMGWFAKYDPANAEPEDVGETP